MDEIYKGILFISLKKGNRIIPHEAVYKAHLSSQLSSKQCIFLLLLYIKSLLLTFTALYLMISETDLKSEHSYEDKISSIPHDVEKILIVCQTTELDLLNLCI